MIKSLVLTVIAAAVAALVLVALPSQTSHSVGGSTSADGVVNTVTPDVTPSPDTLLWP